MGSRPSGFLKSIPSKTLTNELFYVFFMEICESAAFPHMYASQGTHWLSMFLPWSVIHLFIKYIMNTWCETEADCTKLNKMRSWCTLTLDCRGAWVVLYDFYNVLLHHGHSLASLKAKIGLSWIFGSFICTGKRMGQDSRFSNHLILSFCLSNS